MSRVSLPERSLRDVLSLRHPNHFLFAGANNRNVIITYWFLAAPVQANRDFFYIDCMTVYFNCKYFPWYTRELLECLLGISPSGRNPRGGNYREWAAKILFLLLKYHLGMSRKGKQKRREERKQLNDNCSLYCNIIYDYTGYMVVLFSAWII